MNNLSGRSFWLIRSKLNLKQKFERIVNSLSFEIYSSFIKMFIFTVKRDVQENDEEAVQVKEQSILELGSLLAKTGQAEGKFYI